MQNLTRTYEGKKVLITGGLGFIGSNLAHRLVELGSRVTIVDSLIPDYGGNLFNLSGIEGQLRINIADIRDKFGMLHLAQKQDYIFNLAGQVSHLDSVEDPITDLEINCRAQVNLLEACRRSNPTVKIVYASTRQVYGRPKYLPVDEDHPVEPVDPNGINKMAGEYYHLLYSRLYGLNACSLRLTNTYGPRMRVRDARQTFIGWWFRQIQEGDPIRVFGTGKQLRDLNYIEDVVDAFLLVASTPECVGHFFNLGAEAVTLHDLAELLVKANGTGKVEIVPFPEDRKNIDIGDFHGNYQKLKSFTGWQPRVMLADGLKRTIDYYRRYAEHYW